MTYGLLRVDQLDNLILLLVGKKPSSLSLSLASFVFKEQEGKIDAFLRLFFRCGSSPQLLTFRQIAEKATTVLLIAYISLSHLPISALFSVCSYATEDIMYFATVEKFFY